MGRPPKRSFINVSIALQTREALKVIKHASGLPTQGDVVDAVAAEIQRLQSLGQIKADAREFRQRGSPSRRVLMNTAILSKTCDAMAKLKDSFSVTTQGDLLDIMVRVIMLRRPKKSA
jgi:hypothetical protein